MFSAQKFSEGWWKGKLKGAKLAYGTEYSGYAFVSRQSCDMQPLQGPFLPEHARPLNKRLAWRLTTGSAFIKMARLKVILAIILLVGLGECARNLIKCVVCKNTLTWSQQKQRRSASTCHEILSNFISPLDLDNSARVCNACRIALTSAKSKQSAETFVDASRHFQFPLF